MGNKEKALFKMFGSFGVTVNDTRIDTKTKKKIPAINGSCGKCNKTYPGHELVEKETKLDNEFYKYRLTYSCPIGHIVFGADVERG